MHSVNDLRQWVQLLLKGADFLKIDGHYEPDWFCLAQPRAHFDIRGCLLLSHDPPAHNETYFTADDVVSFISSPSVRPLLTGKTRVLLYLVPKIDLDIFPPIVVPDVNSLWSDWVANLTEAIETLALNVGIVDDGLGDSRWPTTYGVSKHDVSNHSSCVYSDAGSCANMLVLNNEANPIPLESPVAWIELMCPINFGKFKNSTYPWVSWEPTDQKTVVEVVDRYLECGQEHQPGFRIAINIDPVQLNVFAGSRSGLAWNQPLLPSASGPQLVHIGGSAAAAVSLLSVVSTAAGWLYQTISSAAEFGPPSVSSGRPLANFDASRTLVDLAFEPSASLLVALDSAGAAEVYRLDQAASLVWLSSLSLGAQSLSVDLLPANESSSGSVLVQSFIDPVRHANCSVLIQTWALSTAGTEATPLAAPVCVTSTSGLAAASASVGLVSTELNATGAVASGLLVFGDASLLLHAAAVRILAGGQVEVCVDDGCQAQPPVAAVVDVGARPSVSVVADASGALSVFEAHGAGYCFNSDWHNKRAIPLMCDTQPLSCQYALVYNYGSLLSWQAHIFQRQGIISPCSNGILHGVYNQGDEPSAVAFAFEQHVTVAALHTGFAKDTVDEAGCGFPLPFEGVVLDGFPLPPLPSVWPAPLLPEARHVAPAETPRRDPAESGWCQTCKETMFAHQQRAVVDYARIFEIVRDTAAACDVSVAFGDSVANCKNLAFQYFPELAVEALQAAYSSLLCNELPVCKGAKHDGDLPALSRQAVERLLATSPTSNAAVVRRSGYLAKAFVQSVLLHVDFSDLTPLK
eukprot:TRINITY_DN14272_c0_g1_i1.p1 TRINITY_DN14272_c0_g1~~TRINITY_DN14272_c0_g1_i1.p1  ORF type:complete len:879 (+),score=273.81 TRINITY_DN14272_c0_g1_i1:226-2637(+)